MMRRMHLLFWVWYSIGFLLLLFVGVPDALSFSNGLFLVFYALYTVSLLFDAKQQHRLSDQSVSITRSITLWGITFLIWLGGMGVEWLGIHTGWPFGEYSYSKILGNHLAEVPVTMGFAWIAVVLNAVLLDTAQQGRYYKLLRALKVGCWIVIMDLVLDPVAFDRNFWSWEGDGGFYGVPVTNYVSWFVIGGLLSMLLPRISVGQRIARRAVVLYQMILLLFGLMGLQSALTGSFLAAVVGILLAEGSYRYAYRKQVQLV